MEGTKCTHEWVAVYAGDLYVRGTFCSHCGESEQGAEDALAKSIRMGILLNALNEERRRLEYGPPGVVTGITA